jgi:hypothetical protein
LVLTVCFRERIPPETMGRKRIMLCMNQYKMQFGVTRVPVAVKDQILHDFPAKGKEIMVMAENQIFMVQVINEDGQLLTIEKIESQLKKVLKQLEKTQERQLPIGVLTSEQRDKWTEV